MELIDISVYLLTILAVTSGEGQWNRIKSNQAIRLQQPVDFIRFLCVRGTYFSSDEQH